MENTPKVLVNSDKGKRWADKLRELIIQAVTVDSPPKVDPRREYPKTVAECIDEEMKYKSGVVEAIKKFRDSQPWRGTLAEIQYKYNVLNASLSKVYKIDEPKVVFVTQFPVGPCCFPTAKPAVIMMEELRGSKTYSVVAYLHEFAHAIGHDEKGACRWSLNLFKRYFPKAYEALEPRGHLLFKKKEADEEKKVKN